MSSLHQNQEVKQQLNSLCETCCAAKELASQLANNMTFDSAFQSELARLDELTKQIAGGQSNLTKLLAGQGMQRLPTAELRGLAANLAEHINQLLPLFDQIEKRVDLARNRLNPQPNRELQAKRMQAAYSNSTS